MGKHLDYKQEIADEIMARAKAECAFSERLYEILLAYQEGRCITGHPPAGIPPGNVGDLNFQMSRLYNQIWSVAMNLQERAKQRKSKQQMEVSA